MPLILCHCVKEIRLSHFGTNHSSLYLWLTSMEASWTECWTRSCPRVMGFDIDGIVVTWGGDMSGAGNMC